MTDGMASTIVGIDSLVDRLTKLPEKLQRKVVTKAARKGAAVIRDAARANARAIDDPETSANIGRNITIQSATRLGRQNGGVAMRVGVLGGARAPEGTRAWRKTERRRKRNGQASLDSLGEFAGAGKGNPGGDTFHWRFLEFGAPGAGVAPVPLLRAAAASSENKSLTVIATEISAGLDKMEQLD